MSTCRVFFSFFLGDNYGDLWLHLVPWIRAALYHVICAVLEENALVNMSEAVRDVINCRPPFANLHVCVWSGSTSH